MVPDGEGGLLFNRPPRMLSPAGPATVRFPGIGSGAHGRQLSPDGLDGARGRSASCWRSCVHKPQFLLFTLLSPVMRLSNYMTQRRGGTRSSRGAGPALTTAPSSGPRPNWPPRSARRPPRRRRGRPGPGHPGRRRRRAPGRAVGAPADRRGLPAGCGSVWPTCRHRSPSRVGRDPAVWTARRAEASTPLLRQVPALVDLAEDGVLGIAGDRAGRARRWPGRWWSRRRCCTPLTTWSSRC